MKDLQEQLANIEGKIDTLTVAMHERFDRIEVAILDVGSRLLAAKEVVEIKAKMSAGGSGAPPATPTARAAKARG